MGIQIRDDLPEVEAVIAKMNNETDAKSSALERGLLAQYELGCTLPLGVYSEVNDNSYRLKAVLGVLENEQWVEPKSVDLTGTDIDELVKKAFEGLK